MTVTRRSIALWLVAATVLSAFAWPRAAAAAPLPTANDALGAAMDQMKEAVEALSKANITKDNALAALENLKKFQLAVITAKGETPDTAKDVDEKKRPAFVADFKKSLVDVLKLACDAETAVLNEKYKDADTLVRNKLGAAKSAGHSKFKQDK